MNRSDAAMTELSKEEKRQLLEEWEKAKEEVKRAQEVLANACTNIYQMAEDRTNNFVVFKWKNELIKFGIGYANVIKKHNSLQPKPWGIKSMTTETTEYKVDRTGWTPGPWDEEPDRLEWDFKGILCLMRRIDMGSWCGYIRLEQDHPWVVQSYFNIDCEVHGGLTYAGNCPGNIDSSSEEYWVGFDCLHCGDRAPGREALMRKLGSNLPDPPDDCIYRTVAYVRIEVENLARQALKAAAKKDTQ
jgi:hypothetical protein